MKKLTMYILIKEDTPNGHAANCAAHAAVKCFNKYKDDPLVQEWIEGEGYYKVTCKVTPAQFEYFKEIEHNYVVSEDRLDDREIAIAFKPRETYPKEFKELPLWS